MRRRSAPIWVVLVTLAALAVTAPVATARRPGVPPQNPFLAPDPFSNIHNDSWMSNAYSIAGPTRGATLVRGGDPGWLCGSLTFDRAGQIVSVCLTAAAPPQARLIDPTTLKVLATYELPTAPTPSGTALFQNFGGGGYFFLDEHDRVWTATKTRHIVVLAIRKRRFVKVADYDLTRFLNPEPGADLGPA